MPAKRAERARPSVSKDWGRQRRALELTIRALRDDYRIEDQDAAHIQSLRVLADRIDDDGDDMTHRDLGHFVSNYRVGLEEWLGRLDERRAFDVIEDDGFDALAASLEVDRLGSSRDAAP